MSQKQRQKAEQARRRRRTRLTVAASVVVVAVLVVGGGALLSGSDDDGGGAAALEVSMVEFAFDPVGGTASPGASIAVRNDGEAPHSYVIPELGKGVQLDPGEEGTVELPDDATPGSYRVICDLSGHIEAGMEGTLEVA